jgi:hypothetical protein
MRSAVTVMVLLGFATIFCLYILGIDDYVADTAPVLTRTMVCLGAQMAALGFGAFLGAIRSKTRPFTTGMIGGSMGAIVLFGATALLDAGGDLHPRVWISVLGFGLAISTLGAGMGTITWRPHSESRGGGAAPRDDAICHEE